MRHILLLTLLAFLLLPAAASAQKKQGQARLDSLLAEVPKMREDSSGVKLLDQLSYEYLDFEPQAALTYGHKALALAKKLDWKPGLARAYNAVGNADAGLGNLPAALETYYAAMRLYEQQNDLRGVEGVTGNIGNIFSDQDKPAKALEYHFKDLKLCLQLGLTENEVIERLNIAQCYLQLRDPAHVLTYAQEAVRLAGVNGYGNQRAEGLGLVGSAWLLQKKYGLALRNYFAALRAFRLLHNPTRTGDQLSSIGETYLLLATDSIGAPADSLVAASRAVNLDRSIDFLQQAEQVYRTLNLPSDIAASLKLLSRAYAAKGGYQQALATFQRSVVLKDSLFRGDNGIKIAQLETQRAVELKDKDIEIAKLAVAKKRNERWFFLAGIGLLLGIMGILFRSFRRQQHSNVLLSREKQRSDTLLLNILPAEVAEELKQTGGAHAQQYDEVSVLFTDFVDFTGTSERLSPQQLVQELHECFTAFDAIIERNGLEKIKTIGDAYMAVGGLPVRDADHAKKAVQAAIEIRDFIEDRKTRERTFEVRIGINSGPVVAGIVGVKKFAYDIWGDTVNTAARMEQHGAPGEINISHSTYELVKEDYRCDYRGKVAAKNKGEVEMYFMAGRA